MTVAALVAVIVLLVVGEVVEPAWPELAEPIDDVAPEEESVVAPVSPPQAVESALTKRDSERMVRRIKGLDSHTSPDYGATRGGPDQILNTRCRARSRDVGRTCQ